VVFAKLGMSPSEAIRIFYTQVELCQGLPFAVRIPNPETLAAIREIDTHPERLRRYRTVEEMFAAWDADETAC
jgi:addiction module RelB/DinJ family antitoxin